MHTRKEELSAIKMLTARSDFLATQSSGTKWISTGLIVQIRANDLGIIRTGYTISKKIDKSAVNRNRIKRRLRAVAAAVLSSNAQVGYDYILVGRKMTISRPYLTLVNDLKWCLKKTGFYKDVEQGK